MKPYLKEYYSICTLVILIVLLLFMTTGCGSDYTGYSSFRDEFRSPEKLILAAFTKHIQSISTSDFPLASFRSNSALYEKPVYAQKVHSDNNLQFFPAVLWQIYALNGKTKWKHIAENYSTVLYEDRIVEKLNNFEAIQSVYLTRYLVDRNQTNKSSLLDILSQCISSNEKNQELHCDTTTSTKVCIEQLLENRLLFFASNETGDPVYAQLARQNSEYIFEHYFQDGHFNELYERLADYESLPDIHALNELNSENLYHLALIFYGFTILDNQQENERYHLLCVRLADLFTSIFADVDTGGISNKQQKHLIAEKMDTLSKTWVCLALKQLNARSENHYKETAERIFNQVLGMLNQPDEKKKRAAFL